MAIIKFKINQEEHYIEGGGIQNDTTGTTDVIEKIRSGTKSEYDLLGTYDPDTYYIITDEGEGREYIISNTTGTTQKITNIRKGTEAEYDLLGTYDSRCYYIISDKPEAIVNNRTGTTGIVESIWYGTKAEFDLLATKDEKCIYVVDTPQTPIGPGVYHNATLGVISLSSDGTNWITIADEMLSGIYQWGNNNEYSSAEEYTQPYDADLWGGVTDTFIARQGPCPSGYHVPSYNEAEIFLAGAGTWDRDEFFGYKQGEDRPDGAGYSWQFWTSDSDIATGSPYLEDYGGIADTTYGVFTSPIIPFKNEAVTPDDTWTVLYQPTP